MIGAGERMGRRIIGEAQALNTSLLPKLRIPTRMTFL
jgi:hypothetical protein